MADFHQVFDLALFKLASPIPMGENVSALCLSEKEIEPQQLCVTAGFKNSTIEGMFKT